MAIHDQWPEEVREALEAYTELDADRLARKGTNGYVVFGRHKLLGTRLALKVYYHDDVVQHEEPRLLTRVDNAHVLKVFDARLLSGHSAYFVTPEADGGDLEEVLATGVDLPRGIRICRGVLEGLSALHAPPDVLIHRDLKPDNILFHEGRPVIGDFGSVRLLPNAEGIISASGQSILYKAPETVTDQRCDVASDVYQAGVIGYQLVGGSLSSDLLSYMGPAERRSLAVAADDFMQSRIIDEKIGKKITSGTLLDWNALPPFVPRAVTNVLKRATHKTRERRYSSTTQFLAALAGLPPLPKWSVTDNGLLLESWHGNDYRVVSGPARTIVYKCRAGTEAWRRDNHLAADSVHQVLVNMQNRCKLVL